MFNFFFRNSLGFKKHNKTIILLFHRVGNLSNVSLGPMSSVFNVNDFEKVIAHIAERYLVLSLNDAFKKNGSPNDKYRVVITFDDGYLDTLTEALPVLEKYQVPATVYVTSGFVSREAYPYEFQLAAIIENGKQFIFEIEGHSYNENATSLPEMKSLYNRLKDRLRPMSDEQRQVILKQLAAEELEKYTDADLFLSWDQVKQIHNHPLMTIGAHTYSHMQLDLVSIETARQDIQKGTEELEQKMNARIDHFAYPYGGYNKQVIDLINESKFLTAVTTKPGFIPFKKSYDNLTLPRIEFSHRNIDTESEKLEGLLSQ